jgi:hypothetical protein
MARAKLLTFGKDVENFIRPDWVKHACHALIYLHSMSAVLYPWVVGWWVGRVDGQKDGMMQEDHIP